MICSLIIVLALVDAVFAIIDIDKCEKTEKSHDKGEEWLNSEEYENLSLLRDTRDMQFMFTFSTVLCSVALMTAVMCWNGLKDAVENPKFLVSEIINKRLLKIQIPYEIICICIDIAVYSVLQFVRMNNVLFYILIVVLYLSMIAGIMIILNVVAYSWQKQITAPMLGNPHQPKL